MPASLVVAEHGDTSPEGFIDRPDRLVVIVGKLDGHHDRIIFEDFAELTELNFLVKAGQVAGHRRCPPDCGLRPLGGARPERSDRPKRASSP